VGTSGILGVSRHRLFGIPIRSRDMGTDVGVRRLVFRLGVIEVGPGYVSYRNRTASGKVQLAPEQEARWHAFLDAEENKRKKVPLLPETVRAAESDVLALPR
jgi:hypothetical protein